MSYLKGSLKKGVSNGTIKLIYFKHHHLKGIQNKFKTKKMFPDHEWVTQNWCTYCLLTVISPQLMEFIRHKNRHPESWSRTPGPHFCRSDRHQLWMFRYQMPKYLFSKNENEIEKNENDTMRIGHNKKSGITSGNVRGPHPSGFVVSQMRAFKHNSASVGVDSPSMIIASLLQVQKSLRWFKNIHIYTFWQSFRLI